MADVSQPLDTDSNVLLEKSDFQETDIICPDGDQSESDITGINSETEEKDKIVYCNFYQTGGCRFGDSCINVHDTDPDFVKPAMKHKKSPKKKKSQPDEGLEEGMCAKCRKHNRKLRTVMDVVHRIQWDDQFNPEDFVVGFLDRFDGMVEEAFPFFDWSDVTTVDDWETFCIPKHRVYYFKCRGEVVWDRRTRLDRIFESKQVKCGECSSYRDAPG